jgi:TIR domain
VQVRSAVVSMMKEGKHFLFCSKCGYRISLAKAADRAETEDTLEQERVAEGRTEYQTALVQIKRIVEGRPNPTCFLSYAWGNPEHERWVRNLAGDLRTAGIEPIFDKENGASSMDRFLKHLVDADFVIIIGTPLYKQKYENEDPRKAHILSSEVRLINERLIGPVDQIESTLLLLQDGDCKSAFPGVLGGFFSLDFREKRFYFARLLELVLKIHKIPHANYPEISKLLVNQR